MTHLVAEIITKIPGRISIAFYHRDGATDLVRIIGNQAKVIHVEPPRHDYQPIPYTNGANTMNHVPTIQYPSYHGQPDYRPELKELGFNIKARELHERVNNTVCKLVGPQGEVQGAFPRVAA